MKVKLRKIITFSLLTYALKIQAYTHDIALKGGLSYTWADLEATEKSEDSLIGVGFNTHFIYRWDRWDISASSYIYWGDIDGLAFKAQGQKLTGDGHFRHVSFGPIFRYTFKKWPVYNNNWHPYLGLGPSWSLQTIKIDKPPSEGSFSKSHKLTYLSQGGFITVGVEEETRYKEMNPVYIEFLYSYKKSKKVSVIDSSDSKEINILSTNEAKQDFSGHFFMVSMGITIF